MNEELIQKFFTDLFSSGRMASEVTIIWHSGEPLVLPPSYYDDAISTILELRDQLAPGTVALKFDIQTNGVLINDEWCQFFQRHQHHLEVGISCDGPGDLHDSFRLNWSGRSTHALTTRGMDLLHRSGIKYKVIAVVTRKTLYDADGFYQFFSERRDQLSAFHFNIVADGDSVDPDLAYSAEDRDEYYAFYRRLLELGRSSRSQGRELDILNFSQAVGRIATPKSASDPTYFEESSAPLKSLSVDTSGTVTTFYAGLSPETLPDAYGDGKGLALGNIFEMSIEEMAQSEKLRAIIRDFDRSRTACETSCGYFGVCTGGFELTKVQKLGSFDESETVECMIQVKTLNDALLDDIDEHLMRQSV